MKLIRPLFILALFSVPSLSAQEEQTPVPVPMPTASLVAASPTPAEIPAATPTPGQPAELYDLDYNEETDLFLLPGTQKPFSGPVKATGDNGRVELTGTLLDGKRTGMWESFYEDGTPASKGAYKDDEEEGPWVYWFENGRIQNEGAFAKGQPIGIWKGYYEDGKPATEGAYRDGLPDGAWKVYDEETGESRIVKYLSGEQIP